MHPDAGAIIGISLAGSVLVVALLFLCMLNLPCCKQQVKPGGGGGGGSRRNPRPSTSSRSAILNFQFTGSTRNIRSLSALDLHNQNQASPHFISGSTAGLSNPLWQMQCHSCGMFVAASQHSLNHHHQCSNNQVPCHCYHHPDEQQPNRNNSATGHSPNNVCANNSTTSFQYSVPQLLSPAESPPPYPGSPYNLPRGSTSRAMESTSAASSSSLAVTRQSNSNPPPYNPKY